MPRMTFYRQARVDGGIRTGLEWEDLRAFETFQEGPPEAADDPLGAGLLWFVDVVCEGDSVPDDPDAAREWMITNGSIIQEGLSRLAETLRAGWDVESYPIHWEGFEAVPEGISLRLLVSAMRRVDARQLSDVLRDIAAHWEQYLRALEPYSIVDS